MSAFVPYWSREQYLNLNYFTYICKFSIFIIISSLCRKNIISPNKLNLNPSKNKLNLKLICTFCIWNWILLFFFFLHKYVKLKKNGKVMHARHIFRNNYFSNESYLFSFEGEWGIYLRIVIIIKSKVCM